MLNIERDVPMPVRRAVTVWPFAKMGVGDSFAVPPGVSDDVVRAAARNHVARRQPSAKYAVRKDASGCHRCWRIE
jgi:hypothetical protein